MAQNPEKGAGTSDTTLVQQIEADWHYHWGYSVASGQANNPWDYVPMSWGGGGTDPDDIANYLLMDKVNHLLAFNEPDDCNAQSGQYGGMCQVPNAVAYYAELQKAGLRLGSPATREGFTWMTDFIDQAEAIDLRVDYVALHWYDWGSSPATNTTPTPEQVFSRFKAHLSNAYAKYRRPLWITEFNANPNRARDIQDGFLELALPYLEQCGYVERYAWFQPNGGNGDFRDSEGLLTSTGLIYKNHASSTAYHPGTLPKIWQADDVGAATAAGDTLHRNGTFTVCGSGTGIAGTADGFHYVHQPVTGDVTITAKVNSMVWRHNDSRAGVMLREDLSAGSRHVTMALCTGNGAKLVSRSTTDGSTATITNSGVTAPGWVRLVRLGDVLTGYRSDDGVTWTTVGSRTIAMNQTLHVGLAVSSHNSTAFNDAIFTNVQITTAGPSYNNWAAGNNLGIDNSFTDDVDGDGLTNGMEYVLGSNPTLPGAQSLGPIQLISTSAFSLTHPNNPQLGNDVMLGYEWSTNLLDFHADGASAVGTSVTFIATPNSPDTGTTTVNASISGEIPTGVFVRLRANWKEPP